MTVQEWEQVRSFTCLTVLGGTLWCFIFRGHRHYLQGTQTAKALSSGAKTFQALSTGGTVCGALFSGGKASGTIFRRQCEALFPWCTVCGTIFREHSMWHYFQGALCILWSFIFMVHRLWGYFQVASMLDYFYGLLCVVFYFQRAKCVTWIYSGGTRCVTPWAFCVSIWGGAANSAEWGYGQ